MDRWMDASMDRWMNWAGARDELASRYYKNRCMIYETTFRNCVVQKSLKLFHTIQFSWFYFHTDETIIGSIDNARTIVSLPLESMEKNKKNQQQQRSITPYAKRFSWIWFNYFAMHSTEHSKLDIYLLHTMGESMIVFAPMEFIVIDVYSAINEWLRTIRIRNSVFNNPIVLRLCFFFFFFIIH